MKVTKISKQVESSETNGDHLVNAMRMVNTSSQAVESVKNRVEQIERQIRESGLGTVPHYISSLMSTQTYHP